jgi:hypothetical protein
MITREKCFPLFFRKRLDLLFALKELCTLKTSLVEQYSFFILDKNIELLSQGMID